MARPKTGQRLRGIGPLWCLGLLVLATLLAGCGGLFRERATPTPEPAEGETPGLANPASVYCQEQGGRVEIRTTEAGQVGYCVFPDGSECEEWAFYRGECAAGRGSGTPPARLPGVLPPADAPTAELVALVQGQLPANAFSDGGVTVLPLYAPADSPPLWAVYSNGLRNYELDPPASHFVAVYTFGPDGWRELARAELDKAAPEGQEPLAAPDYLGAGTVTQVAIEPSRLWLQVEGGAGAHSGTYHLLSFDGRNLRAEVVGVAPSPGVGRVEDVNGDGRNDVVLDVSDPYVFCYACGVRRPAFEVYTWLGDAMAQVELSPLMMGQRGTPADVANGEALTLVQAGLWADALAKIDEAVALAGSEDLPTPTGSLRWNRALIRLHHDALLQAIANSAYPLVNHVFYGDYAGALDLMRAYPPQQVFSAQSPLVVGTVAEQWTEALGGYLVQGADAALAVRPDMAPAYAVRAWGRFLLNPNDPAIAADLAQASSLAPNDAYLAEAAAALRAPAQPPAAAAPGAAGEAIRLRLPADPGSTAVPGTAAPGRPRTYVLTASQGQTLSVSADAPANSLVLSVQGADGTVLVGEQAGAMAWLGAVPATQDYYIRVTAPASPVTFRLRVALFASQP
ncbi:MAG: DUF333 domain-containing protein [Caldilineales bacterium]|nr:DUF333 domain-containing protein [Caldilineales bacterium]